MLDFQTLKRKFPPLSHLSTIFLLPLCLGLSFLTLAQPPGNTDYYSRADGPYTNSTTWSDESHGSPSCSCNPGCNMTGNGFIYIAHAVTSDCSLFSLKGNRKLYIEGGKLSITGDVEVKSNTQLNIAEGDSCIIDGDLFVNGNGSMGVDGFLYVTGDVTTSGNGSVCGSGIAQVDGNISGSGWCMGLGILPVELLSFNAQLNDRQEVELKWVTASEQNNAYFKLERSEDGLNFQEIARVDGAGNSSVDTQYEHTDAKPMKGTSYYRLTQVDYDGNFEVFDILAVQVADNREGICELKVVPNPCVPSCIAVLMDCPEQNIRAEILDAGGNFIQQLIPLKTGTDQYSFHLNENNFLAPGMYIISTSSQRQRKTEKILVK